MAAGLQEPAAAHQLVSRTPHKTHARRRKHCANNVCADTEAAIDASPSYLRRAHLTTELSMQNMIVRSKGLRSAAEHAGSKSCYAC